MAIVTSTTQWAQRTASAPDYNAAHTLTFWARRTASATGGAAAGVITGDKFTAEDLLEIFSGTDVAALAVSNGGFTASAQQLLVLNTWQFIALVREDVSTLKLYVGDISTTATLIGTATRDVTGRTAATKILIGARFDDGAGPFDGEVDSGNQWTVGLSAAQVEAQRLYQNPQSSTGLWATWPFQADGLDSSGNGRDMTLTGTPSYVTGPDINRSAGVVEAGTLTPMRGIVGP